MGGEARFACGSFAVRLWRLVERVATHAPFLGSTRLLLESPGIWQGTSSRRPRRGILGWTRANRVTWPHGHMATCSLAHQAPSARQCYTVPAHQAPAHRPASAAGSPVPGSASQCHTAPLARVTWSHGHMLTCSLVRAPGSATECHPPSTQLGSRTCGPPSAVPALLTACGRGGYLVVSTRWARPSPSDARCVRDGRARRRRSFACADRRSPAASPAASFGTASCLPVGRLAGTLPRPSTERNFRNCSYLGAHPRVAGQPASEKGRAIFFEILGHFSAVCP